VKKLILLLLALSFLFSCAKQQETCEEKVGGESICVGNVKIGGVYGKHPNLNALKNLFKKTE